MDYMRGDVLYGRKGSPAIHPIIFWEDFDETFFIGVMVTSNGEFETNIPLKPEYINSRDEKGVKFEFQYRNTNIVKAKLLKRKDWAPFRKIGEITEEGIHFIGKVVDFRHEILWEEFVLES